MMISVLTSFGLAHDYLVRGERLAVQTIKLADTWGNDVKCQPTLLRLPAHCETHRTSPTMSRRPCARREQRWERAHGSQCLHGRPFLPHAFASRAVAQCPLERTNVSAAEHPLRAESRGVSCRGRGYGRYSLLRCTCDSRQPPPTTAPAPKQQTHAFRRVQVSAEGMTHR